MSTNQRHSHAYTKWRRDVLKHCEPTCIRCGYPVDMSLPSRHPDGPSADHEPPFAETGEIAPSLDSGSGIAHLRCNKIHGGTLGSKRALDRKRSLGTTQDTPAAPSRSSPGKARVEPDSGPQGPRMHRDGWVMPRLESAVPGRVRGSLGGDAAAWLKATLGLELRAWQRYAMDRALEVDEDGRLVWPTVIITVGRQSGKSVLSRAVCMWRLHHADRFGEQQTILHVANKTDTAREVMRPAGLWAAEQYGKKAVRWGNSMPGITLPSGDRWLVQAANDSSGVGYTVSMAFVDEAWRVDRQVVDDALAPTMAEREQPQMWLVSTAGDSQSDLMSAYRQRAIDQLADPTSLLLLEWSAPPDAEPDLEETWRWGSPEWTPRRAQFLRQQFEAVEVEAFRREFLNQWTISANHWLKDAWWAGTVETAELPKVGTWVVALESDFDGSGHAVAVAVVDGDGLVHVRATTHRTIREADEQIGKIRKTYPTVMVLATPGYVDRLRSVIDQLVGNREAVSGTQVILDLFERKMIRHDGHETLHQHLLGTTIARRQAGWTMTAPQGRGGVYAARAVMFAAWQATKTPRPTAVVRAHRRRA